MTRLQGERRQSPRILQEAKNTTPESTPTFRPDILTTDTIKMSERNEKVALQQAKAEAKFARSEARERKAAVKRLKAQIALDRADRNRSLAKAGLRRGAFGRVVRVRRSRTGHAEHYRSPPKTGLARRRGQPPVGALM